VTVSFWPTLYVYTSTAIQPSSKVAVAHAHLTGCFTRTTKVVDKQNLAGLFDRGAENSGSGFPDLLWTVACYVVGGADAGGRLTGEGPTWVDAGNHGK